MHIVSRVLSAPKAAGCTLPQAQLRRNRAPLPTPIRDRSRDKALLIGIEYKWPPSHDDVSSLSNPHSDVDLLWKHLVEHEGYLPENITVLRDGPEIDSLMEPNRLNILREIDRLVEGVKPGDRRVFFFGGHGTQLLNRTGSEVDGMDEAILTCRHEGWPVDANNKALPTQLDPKLPPNHLHRRKLKGVIVDNELRERLVNPLPSGSQLVAIFETCHSGTILDLDSKTWKRRASNVVSLVPKSYKHIRKGIRSATFTHLAPGDLIPKSIPGKKFIVKTLKKRPPPTRSQTWQEKHFGHGGVSGQAAIISFSSADDDQRTWSTQDKTMISVIVDFLRHENPHERHATPRDLEHHIRIKLEQMRTEDIRCKVNENPSKWPFLRDIQAFHKFVKKLCGMQVPRVSGLDDKVLRKPLRL